MTNLKPQKYYWIDLTRSIGAFCIILIHVSDVYAYLYKSLNLFDWISSVFLNVIPRSAVLLFVAISGYTLLEKQDDVMKRVYKLLKPFVFWSLFYLLLAIALNIKTNTGFIKELLLKGIVGAWAFAPHLWFFYMLLGLYISLPISRLLFQYLDLKGSIFLGCAFVCNSIIYHITSTLSIFNGEQWSSSYSSGIAWGNLYFGCFILPRLIIDKQYFKVNKNYLIFSILASTLISFLLTIFTCMKQGFYNKVWEDPQSIFTIIQAFSVLVLLERSEGKIQQVFSKFTLMGKLVSLSSKYTLGIYGVHWFFVRLIFYAIDRNGWQPMIQQFLWLNIILMSILVWILCLSTSMLASKNKFLKQVF
jgi:surface polysaccharide O-acyltransferase-like enzyme